MTSLIKIARVEMGKADLCLPVIRMNEESIVKIDRRTVSSIHRLSEPVVRRGKFRLDTVFIDSALKRFEVLQIVKERRSFHWSVLGAKTPSFVVDYKLSTPRQLSFDEVLRSVIDSVVRHRWYAQGGETEAEFKSRMSRVKDMGELTRSLTAYGKVEF